MSCTHIKAPGGFTAIVCTRGRKPQRCGWCTHTASVFLCDWKIGKGKTCDKPLCAQHAQEVAPDKHLCPKHVKEYDGWKRQREKVNT